MAHLSMITTVSSGGVEPVSRRPGVEPAQATRPSHRGEDVAEISQGAREAARAESTPIRSELVHRIRQQIEAGTYLTPEKLDAAADRVAQDLDLLA
jgi:anti-sigma28 factor (negative regulator of flagellin synthesis)